MKAEKIKIRTVLVTGCSSGIGEATAYYLRDRDWQVFPTARKEDDLEKLRTDGFDPIELDLANSESIQGAVKQLLEKVPDGLGALVNNAGFAMPGAVEDLTRDALRKQFEVNLFGVQELTNLIVPIFRKQGWGRIVTVSSIYGVIAAPMVGAYCSSKFALEGLADAQRIELSKTGISLSLVEPGAIVSAFRRNAAAKMEEHLVGNDVRYSAQYEKEAKRRKKQYKKVDFINRPPEDVAKKILHALGSDRPKRRYPVTPVAHIGAFISRYFPTALIDHIMVSHLPES